MLLGAAAASVAPGFHPKELEGSGIFLRAWIDPRDPSTLTFSGSTVTAIVNKATGVSWSSSGHSPTMDLGINDGPSFVGDGTNYFETTEQAVIDACGAAGGHNEHTVVWLRKSSSGAAWGWGISSEAFFNSCFFGGNTYTRADGGAGGTVQWATSVATGGGTIVIVECLRYRGSGASEPLLRRNDADLALTITSGTHPRAVSPTRFCYMARGRSTPDPLVGRMGPLLLYSGSLSDAACDLAADGLLSWYGLRIH